MLSIYLLFFNNYVYSNYYNIYHKLKYNNSILNYTSSEYNVDDLLNSSLNHTSFHYNINSFSNISYEETIYEIINLSFIKYNTINFENKLKKSNLHNIKCYEYSKKKFYINRNIYLKNKYNNNNITYRTYTILFYIFIIFTYKYIYKYIYNII